MPPIFRSKLLPVSAADLDELRRSTLTDQTILANAIYTETDPNMIARLLKRDSRWRYTAGKSVCEGGGIVYRNRDLAGTLNCYARIKPRTPRKNEQGEPIKYEAPVAEGNRAYYPAASLEKLRDGTSPVYVTEGEKKALALSQLGVPAVSIPGVYSWKIKDTEELIPDLAAIPWSGRPVYIVFDRDPKWKTRQYVDGARRRLARALRAAGAKECSNIDLCAPDAMDAKMGADDFLAAYGTDAFRKRVEQAQPVPEVAEVEPLSKASGRTDTANAARLVARYGETIRWVGPWDKWLLWDERRWRIDDALQIEMLAKQIARDLWADVGKAATSGNMDKDTLASMFSFARTSSNAQGIRNMVSLARSELPIAVAELDRDPWLLNVENGTLDLRTGKLREHRKEDYITKLAPVAFEPEAACPRWLAFLETIFEGNEELIGYMQRLAGYSITGSQEEHVLPFLHGTGANGKTTKVETLLKLLGPDYSMKAPPDLLMAKRGESHPTERADLFGKRLVACVETEEGRRLAESLVKEMTGGDRQRARRMREDFWEFDATHHVWLAGNHKPCIVGTDNGIWRRIKLIPFDVVIPDAQQDKKLPAKLAEELSGILNWAIAGCLDWQKNGMQEPEVVQAVTKHYRNDEDEVGQFVDDHCELGEDFMAPATELYAAFQDAMPSSRLTQKSLGTRLSQRGFHSERFTCGPHKARHGWKGLRLRAAAKREQQQQQIQSLSESLSKRMSKS